MLVIYLFVVVISANLLISFTEAVSQTDISGLVGSTVQLPCRIDTKTCGTLHSVKWYRGSSRIFVFSDLVKFSKSEGEYELRANLLYEPNDVISYLEVKNITTADESIYKCEITYLDVVDTCLVVQFINLTTLIAPSYIRIYNDNGEEVAKGSAVGPYNEGTQISVTCEVGEGKPVPTVHWFKNNELFSDNYSIKHGSNAIGSSENRISIGLARHDLGAVYECRASSQALNQSLVSNIEVRVNVKPSRTELRGFEHDVKQNTTVTLECTVYQALPAATIKWYNDSNPLIDRSGPYEIDKRVQTRPDGTADTISRLIFRASRFENMKMFRCLAENEVMLAADKMRFQKGVTVRVLYAPIITVRPERVTVNESKDVILRCDYTANPFATGKTLWYFNGNLLPENTSAYEFQDVMLKLKKVNRSSLGKYFCSISNEVGTTNSSEVFVNVLYPPTVYVSSDATAVVNESSKANISLYCRVENGNPKNLTAVQWFFNNEPMFPYTNISMLILQNGRKEHHGNYACQGRNDADWGIASPQMEVFVQYQPGAANITYWMHDLKGNRIEDEDVIKGYTVVLQCNVDNQGRPKANKYNWYEGSRRRETVNGATLTLEKVGVKEATNLYSCNAENAAGSGPNGSISINIKAPPSFINTMKYANPTIMDESVNMTCDIECDPLCEVKWKKNYTELIVDGDEYQVINRINEASLDKNDFKSITSTLVVNLTRFPDGHAKPIRDDAIYTCFSTSNEVGDGVKTDILYEVHYPPTNVVVSMQVVDVTEGRLPGKVSCRAEAKPEATIRWYNGSSDSTFSTDETLSFDSPLFRSTNTNFTCEASNKYGISTNWVYFNIKFKPECRTTIKEEDGKKILLCTAVGNPSSIRFNWTADQYELKSIRVTEEGSFLEVEDDSESKIYNCTAFNEVGASDPCPIRVPASDDWWSFLFMRNQTWSLVYIIITVVIVIIIVMVICVLIIYICRKRRSKEKYNNRIDLPSRQNFGGNNLDGGMSATVIPKWPLKPGVLVHVNNNHSLNAGRLQNVSNLNTNSNSKQLQNQYFMASEKRVKRGEITQDVGNESQRTRTKRIKQMLFTDQLKYKNDTLPGVFHGKSGVISFKKFDNSVTSTNPRKRKKPGSGPNNLNDKSKDNYQSARDALLHPENEKAFYENLPFHGMQNPPNKQRCDISGIRPPSAQSQFDGSSGYGSTRSQVEKVEAEKCNVQSKPVKSRFSSFRSKRSKRQWPQFRSLRNSSKKNKIPMLPIKESSPDSKGESAAAQEMPKIMPKPVPAPRKVIGFSFNKPSAKHTYQNIPIPIIPNQISAPQQTADNSNTLPKQASSHLSNYSPMEYFRLTSSTNTRMPNTNISTSGSLNKKYNVSANNTLSSSLSRGDVPTIPRHHNSSYPSTHHLPNGLVYADLTVSRHKKTKPSRQPPVPVAISTPQTYPYHTDYAPFRPEFADLDYADVDYCSYGPIDYKAASIHEAQKRNNNDSETEPEDYLL